MITGAETVYYEWAEGNALQIPEGLKTLKTRFPEPEISVSRDKAVRLALQSGARWLFFHDSDLLIPPDTLLRLIERDKPIVGGLYARRHNPPFNEMLRLTSQGNLTPVQGGQYNPGELVECDVIATGCMLVRMDVFEKFRPFQMTIDGRPCAPAYFLWTVDRLAPPTYSEDFQFCVRARECQIPVFCDTSIVCKHLGPMRVVPDQGQGAQFEFLGS